ncbi:hypothetical protein [Paenibacillus illinoisensis]|uniref:Uncharacterized protein n=1 Tax=Paenibacillus illinoisensis TaxID=59845 RepID=A0A2W0CCA7_9BACL|nr:hypothetical protein [Paenibacillus illinoisensis]PYY28329.1 Uncharacterized protein PIL02S_03480 [Paenibacillus illinoisensis]
MKKLTLMIMFVIVSLTMINNTALASGVEQVPKQATLKIEKVYFMKGSGYYVAHSVKDENGRFWVLQVTDISITKEDKRLTQALRNQYQGKQVIVSYNDPANENEETEIHSIKVK